MQDTTNVGANPKMGRSGRPGEPAVADRVRGLQHGDAVCDAFHAELPDRVRAARPDQCGIPADVSGSRRRRSRRRQSSMKRTNLYLRICGEDFSQIVIAKDLFLGPWLFL